MRPAPARPIRTPNEFWIGRTGHAQDDLSDAGGRGGVTAAPASAQDNARHMSDSLGWAVQAGVDINLSDRWFLNLDVKYIDIDTNARLTTTAAGI